jgi:hypothetical protein
MRHQNQLAADSGIKLFQQSLADNNGIFIIR